MERSDLAIERVLEGDIAASPLAASIQAALHDTVSLHAQTAHLLAISREAAPASVVRRRRLAIVAVAAALTVMLLGSSALAIAHGSVPGHPLYGLKRASERMSIAMHRTPSAKAALHLQFAERRLNEIKVVLRRGHDATFLERDYNLAIAAAESLTDHSVTKYLLFEIETRVDEQIDVISDVLSNAPVEARSGLQQMISVASETKERVTSKREAQTTQSRPRPARAPSEQPASSSSPTPSERPTFPSP